MRGNEVTYMDCLVQLQLHYFARVSNPYSPVGLVHVMCILRWEQSFISVYKSRKLIES